MTDSLAKQVVSRAGIRCEYCQMHQSLQGATFHIEHIQPVSEGGNSELDNLALACPGCNLKKSNRLLVSDPATGEQLPMYHPRRDQWSIHFEWNGTRLVGRTPLGNAMIAFFDLNSPRRLLIRHAESTFGLFPPSLD